MLKLKNKFKIYLMASVVAAVSFFAAFGLFIGGTVSSSKMANKVYQDVYNEVNQTEAYKEFIARQEAELNQLYKEGKISEGEFSARVNNLKINIYDNIEGYIKQMDESKQAEIEERLKPAKSLNNTCDGLAIGFGALTLVSVIALASVLPESEYNIKRLEYRDIENII